MIDCASNEFRKHGFTSLRAVVGPHICAQHYEFGEDDLSAVVSEFGAQVCSRTAWGTRSLDLSATVRTARGRCGVAIDTELARCTATDMRYFSHRARAEQGRTALLVSIESTETGSRIVAVMDPAKVSQRAERVRNRIDDAGGDPDQIAIVAVTKGFDSSAVEAAAGAGLTLIGENYAQEMLSKLSQLQPEIRDGIPDTLHRPVADQQGSPAVGRSRRVAEHGPDATCRRDRSTQPRRRRFPAA